MGDDPGLEPVFISGERRMGEDFSVDQGALTKEYGAYFKEKKRRATEKDRSDALNACEYRFLISFVPMIVLCLKYDYTGTKNLYS